MNKHIKSYLFALIGLKEALARHQNLRIHLIISAATIALSFTLKITKIELIFIIFLISFVIVTEVINSAIEEACNAITTSHNNNIRIAKDISAAAVLIASLTALLIGLIIFLPYVR